MSLTSPLTKDDLLRAFEQQDLTSDAYWDAFDTAVFDVRRATALLHDL